MVSSSTSPLPPIRKTKQMSASMRRPVGGDPLPLALVCAGERALDAYAVLGCQQVTHFDVEVGKDPEHLLKCFANRLPAFRRFPRRHASLHRVVGEEGG